MIAEISAALGSLKTTTDLVKGISATISESKLAEVKLDFQRMSLDLTASLLDMQQKHAAALDRVSDLEQQIARMKDWTAEQASYDLHNPYPGAFCYMKKPGMNGAEPAHWLCARCFGDAKKSILQRIDHGDRAPVRPWACPTCKAQISVGWSVQPSYSEAA